MKTAVICPLTLCLFLLTALPVRAEVISMMISATCTGTPQGVIVEVTAVNKGDEAALEVRAAARCREVEAVSAPEPELKPGQSFTARLPLSPKIELPGAYLVEVRVDFQDRNGQPFSALAHTSFAFREGVTPEVFAEPDRVEMNRRGRLSFRLTNKGDSARQVKLRLVLPQELKAEAIEQELRIESGQTQAAVFNLENRSAQDRAEYPVLAFLEYEADGRHYASVAESRVRLVLAGNIFKTYRWGLFAVAAALMLAAGLIQVFEAKAHPDRV